MEIKKFNLNIHSDKMLESDFISGNMDNKPEILNKISRRSTNFSLLTTKTDEILDKITISYRNHNLNQYLNLEDNSILDNLKSKGFLNKTLENKIFEFENDLKKTLKRDTDLSKISLINEINLMNKNIQISSIEQENLLNLEDLKGKKIDILESSIFSINKKNKNLNDKVQNITGKIIKDNKISGNKNWKNILIQHYEIFSYDLLRNIRFNEEEKDSDKLKKELIDLKTNNDIQIMELKDHLHIKNFIAANNKKLEFEKEIKQINNNYFFLENNLSLEKEALKKKLNKYKVLNQKLEIKSNNQSFDNYENRVILEENTFNNEKIAKIEKINYLKNLINNSNVNLLTCTNSIMTKIGDFGYCNNLFTKTNDSMENYNIKLNENNGIKFENYDYLQINSDYPENKYLIKKQTDLRDQSFEICISEIHSQ